jgi:hypothetical protein
MRHSSFRSRRLDIGAAIALFALSAATPSVARAQTTDPSAGPRPAVGERYHVEVSGNLWNPNLLGMVSSEQFGILGSDIDFVGDLGYERTRFRDLRIVVRPGQKHRFRVQYTPVRYEAETILTRPIVFNGVKFETNIPVNSEFNWRVWRLGYEWDFLYRPRGFVGVLFDVRHTTMEAEISSIITATEYTRARAPLPAIGIVGRAYVIPEVAVNFEVSGFRLPDVDPKYQANYFDWDIHGTFNVNEHVGLQLGWRKVSTYLAIESDKGDLQVKGMWFGAAVRY